MLTVSRLERLIMDHSGCWAVLLPISGTRTTLEVDCSVVTKLLALSQPTQALQLAIERGRIVGAAPAPKMAFQTMR